jgi:hypothetical protein
MWPRAAEVNLAGNGFNTHDLTNVVRYHVSEPQSTQFFQLFIPWKNPSKNLSYC